MVPLGGGLWTSVVETLEGDREAFDSGVNTIGPGYFETMGIPLVAGRGLGWGDDEDAAGAIVVNQALAQKIWPGESPIGHRLGRGALWFTVVGVARDANYYELGEDPEPQIYLPVLQFFEPRLNLVVHTRGGGLGLRDAVIGEVRRLEPNLVISRVRTLEDVQDEATSQLRLLATVIGLFGLLALTLAAVGVYGVLSHSVEQRNRELGIRMALGARRDDLLSSVVLRGLRLALIGAAVGLVAALVAARLVESFVFGVSPRDPITLVLSTLVLMAAALSASYLPARRAASIDPIETLRYE